VIQAPRVSVSAAPLVDGEALFDLHAGTTVALVSESRDWLRLRLPDGRDGWVPRSAAEVVETHP
jgi:SH3-like domain-containing protein